MYMYTDYRCRSCLGGLCNAVRAKKVTNFKIQKEMNIKGKLK